MWGSPIELGTQDRMRLIRDKLMRTELLPAFEMSDERVEAFIARIRQMRPKMVFGYPSAISHIAGYAEKKGLRLDDLGVKVVFVTSDKANGGGLKAARPDAPPVVIEDSPDYLPPNSYATARVIVGVDASARTFPAKPSRSAPNPIHSPATRCPSS